MIGDSSLSRGKNFFFPERPYRLWGPPGRWFHVYGGSSGRSMSQTTLLSLVSSLRLGGSIPLLPLYAFMRVQKTSTIWPLTFTTLTFNLCNYKSVVRFLVPTKVIMKIILLWIVLPHSFIHTASQITRCHFPSNTNLQWKALVHWPCHPFCKSHNKGNATK